MSFYAVSTWFRVWFRVVLCPKLSNVFKSKFVQTFLFVYISNRRLSKLLFGYILEQSFRRLTSCLNFKYYFDVYISNQSLRELIFLLIFDTEVSAVYISNRSLFKLLFIYI